MVVLCVQIWFYIPIAIYNDHTEEEKWPTTTQPTGNWFPQCKKKKCVCISYFGIDYASFSFIHVIVQYIHHYSCADIFYVSAFLMMSLFENDFRHLHIGWTASYWNFCNMRSAKKKRFTNHFRFSLFRFHLVHIFRIYQLNSNVVMRTERQNTIQFCL